MILGQAVEVFKALADENRLRIVKLLCFCRDKLCVCELVDALQLPQYAVSRHLNVLKEAGLVECQREGTWVNYWVKEKNLPLIQSLLKNLHLYLDDNVLHADQKRLDWRLSLRVDGRCVIGFQPKEEPPHWPELETEVSVSARNAKF